jgi:ABC-type branched-subunit amino acid transport system ATPase component
VPGDAAVRCVGLTYRFGDHVAVDHVDLQIEPGETFGLLGPNWAGTPANLALDSAVLIGATVVGVTASALLLPRLAR